jgi:hypothetical protein
MLSVRTTMVHPLFFSCRVNRTKAGLPLGGKEAEGKNRRQKIC